jgi:hypothetical protein
MGRTKDEATAAWPLFCPRCRRDGAPGGVLCDDCGEALARRGYCAVCESYWPLTVGTPCPKHDLPLGHEPPRAFAGGDDPRSGDRRWVTVRRFSDALGAEAPRIRLEAEGIPTFVEGERMGSPSMYRVATGGVKLQVPESLAGDARVVLSQSWAPPATDPEGDDLDDAWDELAPDPHALGRDLGRAAVLFVLIAPLLLTLLALLLGRR